MSEQIRANPPLDPRPDLSWQYQPLPPWLARRLLRADETVTWVRGPRWNPSWERYITHPGLFLLALLAGAACVAGGRLYGGSWSAMPVAPAVVAGALVIGSIYVLAIANAYFTRLVVTNFRLLILQGYEVCRSWGIDELPRSLTHYGMWRDGEVRRTVDLDALQTLLGDPTDQVSDSKTIRALGRQLDQIKAHEGDRPRPGPITPHERKREEETET
ncbi:MAG: hypothetical protein L0Z62_24435 [Gemmataceae bacterium]|nr:hypothetical protein [Gemmataceae bacterium]